MAKKKSTTKSQGKTKKPAKQESVKTEYTRAGLIRMSRDEVNEVALGFGLKPKLAKNKEVLADAIMREVLHGDDAIDPETQLNPKQELFCQAYAGNDDRDYFGNGTQAYIMAYDIDLSVKGAYEAARADASRLLTNGNILARIRNIMETNTLNDEMVDKQMNFWIHQHAYPMASIAAIKEYNKVKKRVDNGMLAPLALTQNNYNVSIRDERGKRILAAHTEFMMNVTKSQPTEETLANLRDARDFAPAQKGA